MIAFEASDEIAQDRADNGGDRPRQAAIKPKSADLRTDDWRASATATGCWSSPASASSAAASARARSSRCTCGCPDAMEGPTPVSALVHSATMVAAGVYLVGRFYPVFCPEVLLVIAVIGCITLFLAATIAITAVDIKRVLAYSTVSQLGLHDAGARRRRLGGRPVPPDHARLLQEPAVPVLRLGDSRRPHERHAARWAACGTRCRSPPTRCSSAAWRLPASACRSSIGFSGYYSKDAIVEQAIVLASQRPAAAWLFFVLPLLAPPITAFYMFRLWYMTFAGKPRDHHRLRPRPRIAPGHVLCRS